MKAIDTTWDYFEYLTVISNNLAFTLAKFGLGEQSVEQLKNAIGYLVSYITKDKLLRGMEKQGGEAGILQRTRRIYQRTLLIRLHLRLSFYLYEIEKFEEALEAAREAHSEAVLICLDGVMVSLLVARRLIFIKQRRILQGAAGKGEEESSPEARQQFMNQVKSADGSPSIFSEEQRKVLEHLRQFIPISIELKKHIESSYPAFRHHRKIKQIDTLHANLRGIDLPPLDMGYYYKSLDPEEKSHYLFKLSIVEIVEMRLLSLRDLDFESDYRGAFFQTSCVSFAEKVSWLVIGLYAIAVEKNHVEETLSKPRRPSMALQKSHEGRVPDSEVDMSKALELAYLFLPKKMPWVFRIFQIYENLKRELNLAIPEDGEVNQKVRFLKPLKGGYKTQMIPLIRENERELRNPAYFRGDRAQSMHTRSGPFRQKPVQAKRPQANALPLPGRVIGGRKEPRSAHDMTDLGFLGPKAYKARPPLDAFRDGLLVVGSIDGPEKNPPAIPQNVTKGRTSGGWHPQDRNPRLESSPKPHGSKNMLPMLSEQFSKNQKPKEVSSRTATSGFKRTKFSSIITA